MTSFISSKAQIKETNVTTSQVVLTQHVTSCLGPKLGPPFNHSDNPVRLISGPELIYKQVCV